MNNLNLTFRYFLLFINLLFLAACTFSNAEQNASASKDEYLCTPCGQTCDNEVYTAGGTCSHCRMPLVKRSTVHFKTIQPSEICKYISKNPKTVLLDVRTKDEFLGKVDPELGTLKNAINLPIQELEANISSLAAYKDREIIVYCSRSHRSPRASYILTQNGFKNVTNMAGGMSVMKDNSCKVQ